MALSNWDKKAQATFAKILEVVPEPMRDAMKPQLIAMIEGKAKGAPVTDAVIEKLVREDLPEPQKSVIMGALGLSSDAPPPAEESAAAAQLSWEGASEQMVEKIMSVIPEMLRGAVRPKLLDFIAGKAGPGGSVTENMVVEAIKEMKPPEPFMSQIMNMLAAGSGVDLSKADAILARYEGKQEALFSLLHEVQREYSHLPRPVLSKVSELLSIPLSAVYRIVTSYPAFSLEPKKKHVVRVCDGFACHLKDSDRVYDELNNKAGGSFTLEKVRCIGCCGQEPMVTIDGECGDGGWARDKIKQF
jgi:NADH:ubiquinone oxidoreductase subunit E